MTLYEGQLLYTPDGDTFTVTRLLEDTVTLSYANKLYRRTHEYVLAHLSDRNPKAKYIGSEAQEQNDPVFCAEKIHLADTVKKLETFKGYISGYRIGDDHKVTDIRYSFDETTKEAILSSPYFARMDMAVATVDGQSEDYSVYVGKKGVYHNDELLVCDWRSEIGQRYYIKSEINFKYNQHSYSLYLRRGLDVRNRTLYEYHDEYAGEGDDEQNASKITDPFLLKVIQRKREQGKLTDIIASIQENQNNIITAPLDKSLIVQGCAGSGKTMVLLHRLSFLKFNNRNLDVDKIKILTPNRLFNTHINDLSESLELDKIQRLAVDDYYREIISDYWVRMQDRIRTVAGRKSISRAERADLCRRLCSSSIPGNGIPLTSGFRYTVSETARDASNIILNELGVDLIYELKDSLGIEIRNSDMVQMTLPDKIVFLLRTLEPVVPALVRCSTLSAQAAAARKRAQSSIKYFEDLCSTVPNASQLIETFDKSILSNPDPDSFLSAEYKRLTDTQRSLKERLSFPHLSDERRNEIARNLRITERRLEGVRFWKSELEARNAQRLLAGGRSSSEPLLSPQEANKVLSVRQSLQSFDIIRWLNKSCELLAAKYEELSCRDMLFAMLSICYEACGKVNYPDILLCIDEAQDICPEEYRLIRDFSGSRLILNLYGDVNQLLDKELGTPDWEALNELADFSLFTLNEDYRNTSEIIDYVNSRCSFDIQNIGISGVPVQEIKSSELKELLNNELVGSRRICVISKSTLQSFYKRIGGKTDNLLLPGEMSSGEISYLTPKESKGLEFETCYVVTKGMNDAEKYVALTRPLTQLYVIK